MFYPALDVAGVDAEILLAVVDDCSPTAVEDHGGRLTVFFSTAFDRDRAREALVAVFPAARAARREVDAGDWARRSQQNLQPVTVGRLTIFPSPPSSDSPIPNPQSLLPNPQSLFPNPCSIIIAPSMGFGTGRHATTRLCLAALQRLDLTDAFVLDVGTGSGVLAMAARRLGARRALGIDIDGDAIRSANENLRLNEGLSDVLFERADLEVRLAPSIGRQIADVTTANLTGALLIRSADLLMNASRIGGHLIISGVMQSEQADVSAAFAERTLPVSITSDEEWVGLLLKRTL